jgi:hypothetical protein
MDKWRGNKNADFPVYATKGLRDEEDGLGGRALVLEGNKQYFIQVHTTPSNNMQAVRTRANKGNIKTENEYMIRRGSNK